MKKTPSRWTPDRGYEESHGYGPSHGGPSGPGDAPAPVTPRPKRRSKVPRPTRKLV